MTGMDELVARTVEVIRRQALVSRIGYAWSGGRDSQVLAYLMGLARVEQCVLATTTGLEWPALAAWHTTHAPLGCTVLAQPLDLGWLAAHPRMLFPQGHYGVAWLSLVSRRAQTQFFRREALDLLALGCRRAQGNYVGHGDRYTNSAGVTRWSPMADWSDAQVQALLDRERLPLPPSYSWPRGQPMRGPRVGPVPWPARQWTHSPDHGFEECWQIDPAVIRTAAHVLPAAASWMTRTGHR